MGATYGSRLTVAPSAVSLFYLLLRPAKVYLSFVCPLQPWLSASNLMVVQPCDTA
jgi:hypothetical protein